MFIKSHRFRHRKCKVEVPGLMGITGIHKCILVGYTNQGVYPVTVEFDEEMWKNMKLKLKEFYKYAYLSELLHMKNVTFNCD